MHALATTPVPNHLDDENISTEYQEWFERKVQASLDGLDDGSNRTFSANEWNAIRVARLAMRKGS